MEKFIIKGGKSLKGITNVSGAKNVVLKTVVAACLTDEEVVIRNVPLISDFFVMIDIIKSLGGKAEVQDHTITIQMKEFATHSIALDTAAEIRTSSLFIAPLLGRLGKATLPNPGGCRIGARPIDRTIEGLKKMGAQITYDSDDGYFHAQTKSKKAPYLRATKYRFEKNTHTGTETLILAAVLAEGKTILENAAEEPEVDELIELLKQMGAKITRSGQREITIEGVEKLHGTTFTVGADRNEVVTLAIAAIITHGDITIENVSESGLKEFLEKLKEVGGGFEQQGKHMRFFFKDLLRATDVTTSFYPGFMTDWQGPWAMLMTQAQGTAIIHEAVYENRFSYVPELRKMGARISLFNPEIADPKIFYNFNLTDDSDIYRHAAKILGPVKLHNGVVVIKDLRAGATLVLAALAALGESIVLGVEHLDRGYEKFEDRLTKLGAHIKRAKI